MQAYLFCHFHCLLFMVYLFGGEMQGDGVGDGGYRFKHCGGLIVNKFILTAKWYSEHWWRAKRSRAVMWLFLESTISLMSWELRCGKALHRICWCLFDWFGLLSAGCPWIRTLLSQYPVLFVIMQFLTILRFFFVFLLFLSSCVYPFLPLCSIYGTRYHATFWYSLQHFCCVRIPVVRTCRLLHFLNILLCTLNTMANH